MSRYPGGKVPAWDPRYPSLVRAFNQRWAGRPRYVALCGDADQVVKAVEEALAAGLRLTVKSGGHCYEDFAVGNDGGVIVDLSPMSAVYRDEVSGLYCVEPGAILWDVYRWLYQRHDVTLPGGSCSSVGAGGHVLGGGYGVLSRRDGLTVDYLHAVELVHVTESRGVEVVVARRDAADPAERELLWAHQGGGGGNFGIVTRLWFKDPPAAPAEAVIVELAWPWDGVDRAGFARLTRAFGAFLEANSAIDSPAKQLDVSLELTHRAAGKLTLGATYLGDRPALLDDFVRLMQQEGPSAPTVERQRLPWLYAVQSMSDAGPLRRSKYKSAYHNEPLPDGQLDVLWEFLATGRYANPEAAVSLTGYGCQVNAVDPAATAVAQRSSILKLQFGTLWSDPAADHEHLTWIRGLYRAMYGDRGPYPDGAVDGCFVNYADADLEDWQYLYYKDNYPRLRAVKGRWDPGGTFHHAQSIELP